MHNKLTAIHTFLRVAEAGSFSAAARQLGIKQSAVSQQIAALEHELGRVLLHRTTRNMSLTEQGEYYRQAMQPLVNAMGEVEQQLRPAAQQLQGSLNVQLPSGLGRIFLPHLLGLQKQTPGLQLSLALDDRVSDLVREGVDVAFRLCNDPPDALAARRLARIETPLYAAPDFPVIHSPGDLQHLPHVRYRGIAHTAPLRLIGETGSVDIAVETVFRANSSEGLLQALLSGIGAGGMQAPLAEDAVRCGTLCRVLPGWRLPDRYLYVIYPDGRFISQRARRVTQLVESVLRTLPGVH